MNSIQDSCVSVIATALSHTTINAQIISARGCNAFNTILSIPLLDKADRLTIIKELFLQHDKIIDTHEILDSLTSIAIMTEGYVERDLDSLVKKSIFHAMERTSNSKYNVLMEDVQKALENTVPYDLINVNVTKGSDFSWEDIGGLHEAKKVLTEALIWPSKYGEVFDTCPLRNERGVLLYGLPGTGKTLLAKAIAGQCGFNFISVKGPELLSKYIGASEEAVRNIFQKAQNAKPCILFFDEFDSLAPRRGHDNTGVTDRVVNQLLTNLDGVETLEGVWVLASTSRPDLLDPALLRPGRIGTFIYCSLPNATERLEILHKLSRTLCFTADVNLEAIAEQTDCFTAPDIKALLYTALTLVTNQSECIINDGKNSEDSKIDKATITQEILLSALNVTKPYLQKSDRDRLLKTYDIFDKRRTGSREIIDISAQHITLA
uniref:AAA+ ATPase domain-containing protein n=2 Tax=Clastoptera arizonana TaxID=38151 RepID=A0A1B6DI32_9HEMI